MEVKGFLDMSSREAPEVNTDVTSEHLTQFAFFQAAEGLKAFTVTLKLKSFGHKYGNIYVEEAAVNIMNAANHSIPTFSRGSCSDSGAKNNMLFTVNSRAVVPLFIQILKTQIWQ